MKKLLNCFLVLVMALTLVTPTLAAETVTPTPPEWISEEHYLTFPGDEVYQSENWAKILELRAEAQNGAQLPMEGYSWAEGSPGTCYETALVRLKYSESAKGTSKAKLPFYSAAQALSAAESAWLKQNGGVKDELYYRLVLDTQRYYLLNSPNGSSERPRFVSEALVSLSLTVDDFFDAPYMDQLSQEDRIKATEEINAKLQKAAADVAAYQNRVDLYLDGRKLSTTDVSPEVKNNRVMVPIRYLAESLGAKVEWVQAEQKIVMTRAGTQVIMTVDQTMAYVNGRPIEMDVAPYAIVGRTLIPARYMAEFFGQTVNWDGEKRRVDIVENKSVAMDSNLEAWALAMGAMRPAIDGGHPDVFGEWPRSSAAEDYRTRLRMDWSVTNREELIALVCNMTPHGHNDSFRAAVADGKSLTDAQMKELISRSGAADKYMWPQTMALDKKWGEKGILAWDLSRMSNLAQWAFMGGYLTYAEALALVEPAAVLAKANFTSWKEFYENYLDGYNWWSRNDMTDKDLWTAYRGGTCKKMLDGNTTLFDNTLFTQEIVSVPGITAQQILDGITRQ